MTILRASNIKPLPGSRIDPTHQLGGGLAYWFFNDGRGKQVTDAGPYRNHVTLTSMDPPTDWGPGRDGYVLDFDGSDDIGSTGKSSAFIPLANSPITISVKFRADAIGVGGTEPMNRIINIHRGATPGSSLVMGVGNSDEIRLFIHDYGQPYRWDTNISVDTWYDAVMTYDGSNFRSYLNGVIDGSPVSTGLVAGGSYPTKIGGYDPSLSLFFDGQIEKMFIFPRALTADEVAWLYHEPYSMIIAPDPARFFSIAVVGVDELGAAFVQGGYFMEYRAGSVRAI